MPDNFQALFKDKSSTPRSSTPREKQFSPRQKIIFNLQQDDEEEKVREEWLETIFTLTTLCESRLAIIKTKERNLHKSVEQSRHMEEEGDILIFDTGGERNRITTRRAWNVFEGKYHKQILLGY